MSALTLTAVTLLAPHLTSDNGMQVLDAARFKTKPRSRRDRRDRETAAGRRGVGAQAAASARDGDRSRLPD